MKHAARRSFVMRRGQLSHSTGSGQAPSQLTIGAALLLFLGGSVWLSQLQGYQEQTIAPGVTLYALRSDEPPILAKVVRAKLPFDANLRLVPALAGEKVVGLEKLSEIARRFEVQGKYVHFAINGDFFMQQRGPYQGDPIGGYIENTELISLPRGQSTLIMQRDGTLTIENLRARGWIELSDGSRLDIFRLNESPHPNGITLFTPRFGESTRTNAGAYEVICQCPDLPLQPGKPCTAQVSAVSSNGDSAIPSQGLVLCGLGERAMALQALQVGDKVKILFEVNPPLKDIVWAIGGGPRLLRGGFVSVQWQQEGFSAGLVNNRHARTAVGLADGELITVTVEGYRTGQSRGMTLQELAEFMADLGCQEAMNLDGGSSTTLYVRGESLTQRRDGSEEPIANGLLLFNLAPPAPPERLLIMTSHSDVLAGGRVQVHLRGEDRYFRLLAVSASDVEWRCEPPVGKVSEDGWLRFKSSKDAQPVTVTIQARLRGNSHAEGTAQVRVHGKVERLAIMPDRLVLRPGEIRALHLQAFGAGGAPLAFDGHQVRWEVEGKIGILRDGSFAAGESIGRGRLVAWLGGATTSAELIVGKPRWVVLEEFESLEGVKFQSYPPGVPAGIELVEQPAFSGKSSLKLAYDFTTTTATRAVYLRFDRDIGYALTLACHVFGDGNGHWLRGRIKDAKGTPHVLDFARRVDWKGEWREVKASVPASAVPPLILETIYLVEPDSKKQDGGIIFVDNLRVERVE